METARIKILLRIIEEKSMNRVSEEFGYTPSGITHMMNSFEKDLGLKLLNRTNQGVELTPAGEALIPHFKKILSSEARLYQEIRNLESQLNSVIKIGAYSSIAQRILNKQLREFKNIYPEAKIELSISNRPNAYAGLDSGLYDFVFVGNDHIHDFITLWEEPYYIVFPPYYKTLIDTPTADIHLLEKYPFIMPSYGADTDAEDALKPLGLKLSSSAVVADNANILSMISNGFGISMISEIVLNTYHMDVFSLPITPPVYRDLGVAFNDNEKLTGIKKSFLDFIIQKNPL